MRLPVFIASVAMAAAATAYADSANALIRLLNSRASGSPRGYAEAAEEVARDAAAGHPLQGYVLAIVSRDPDAPPAARLDEATREKYLNASRGRIEKLALAKNNPLAWYLLSLDTNDTNLLQRAALGGNVQALNAWGALLVGKALHGGYGTNEIAEIFSQAYGCFKKAAGEGDPNGLYNLGTCHARGIGTKRDDEVAFNCFRTAAERGHPEAINNIGWFFREGRVVKKDLELATKWFEKSASYRNAYGEFNYALALQRGEGVPQDDEKAVVYFKRAADGGCIEAMDAYGVALWKGRGVKKDEVHGFRWMVKAANLGYPPAMENVATCYDTGKGVKADMSLATRWRIKSKAARGDRHAAAWLRQNPR